MVDLLQKCLSVPPGPRRRLCVASVITKSFIERGLNPPVLVGGSAVSLYTRGSYSTVDIDFKSEDVEQYKELMNELGYQRKGKDFYQPMLDSYVEFPSGPMEDSWDRVREIIVKETNLPIYVVGYEDLILDRVMSYNATNDQGSREWALRMMGVLYEHIDWSYLHKRANKLNLLDDVNKIQREVKRYKEIYRKGSADDIDENDV